MSSSIATQRRLLTWKMTQVRSTWPLDDRERRQAQISGSEALHRRATFGVRRAISELIAQQNSMVSDTPLYRSTGWIRLNRSNEILGRQGGRSISVLT